MPSWVLLGSYESVFFLKYSLVDGVVTDVVVDVGVDVVPETGKTSSPQGNDRSPESNVPRANLISKNI